LPPKTASFSVRFGENPHKKLPVHIVEHAHERRNEHRREQKQFAHNILYLLQNYKNTHIPQRFLRKRMMNSA